MVGISPLWAASGLAALSLMFSGACAPSPSQNGVASGGPLPLEILGPTDVVVEAQLASVVPVGHASAEVVLEGIEVVWHNRVQVWAPGQSDPVPAPPSPLQARANFHSLGEAEVGRRIFGFVSYEPFNPQGLWFLYYALDAATFEPLPGEAFEEGANQQLPLLFREEETAVEARKVALLEYLNELVAVSEARNLGQPLPTDLPRTSMLYGDDPVEDAGQQVVDAWYSLDPEVRSLAEPDVPDEIDLPFLEVQVVLDVDPAAGVDALGLVNDVGISTIEALDPAEGPVAIVARTVAGEPWEVVAYTTEGERDRTLGSVDADLLRAAAPMKIVVDAAGQVEATSITQAQWEQAVQASQASVEPRTPGQPE